MYCLEVIENEAFMSEAAANSSLLYRSKKREFSTISKINLENPESWRDKVFLTFDIDWAHDDVLAECIDLVEEADVSATWFVTHDTPLLKRLRSNPKFELGVHPNFNFLLQRQDHAGGDAREVLERVLALVPDATAIRSHHMTQSSFLLNLFMENGLTHDCNHFIPLTSGVELKPWRLWNDLIRVPYSWEDDIMCIYAKSERLPNIGEILGSEGLLVFDFHPIHVFLNTEHLNRYEKTRSLHQSPHELRAKRYEEKGARTSLLELLCKP